MQVFGLRRGARGNKWLDFYLGVPLLAASAAFRKARPLPREVKRVGLICSPTIGDTILLAGTTQAICSQLAPERVVFFSGSTNYAAARLLPGVTEIVRLPFTNPVKALLQVRRQHLDLLLDFASWSRLTALLCCHSRAPFTVGFRTSKQHRHCCYDLRVEHSACVHESVNFQSLVSSIGVTPVATAGLTLGTRLRPRVSGVGGVVVFHPWATGSLHALREWPAERWIDLGRRLNTLAPTILVTGSCEDRPRVQALIAAANRVGLTMVSAVHASLEATAEVILSADLVVSVNTGIMHLAAALETPTVALNGPTSDRRWGPLGNHACAVNSPGTDCGYLNLGFEFAGNPIDCMDRITVDMVLQAIADLTGRASR